MTALVASRRLGAAVVLFELEGPVRREDFGVGML